MSIWANKKLIKKDQSEHDAAEIINGAAAVAIYFSAHWCPPCRGFTPVLKAFWEANKDAGLVVIFVSSDRTEDDGLSYFNDHGDYYMVPFSDSDLSSKLKKNCSVSGIPMLAVVKKNGEVLHGDGRKDVSNNPGGALAEWVGKY